MNKICTGKVMGMDLKKWDGGPLRCMDQKIQVHQGEVCAWRLHSLALGANSSWLCFDSETLNDIWEAPSCPLLRKHMIRGSYLIHDKSHLPGWERARHKTADRVKRTNGQRDRDPFSTLRHKNISSSFKIPHSIIFYSKVDSNYCLFPQADWMCNFLHLLRSWQFDNCRTATAVLAAEVLRLRQSLFFFFFSASQARLDTNFCHSFPLHYLSSCSCPQNHTFFSRDAYFHLHPLTIEHLKCIQFGSTSTCLYLQGNKARLAALCCGAPRKGARPKQADLSNAFQNSTDGRKTCKLNTSWTIWDDNVWDY